MIRQLTHYYSGRNFQSNFSKERIEKGGREVEQIDAYALWEPQPIQRTPLAKAFSSFQLPYKCCDCFSLAVSRPHSIIDNLILDKTSLHANYICGFFLVRDSVLKLRQFAELFRIGDRMKKNFQLMSFTIDFSSLGGSYKVTLGATCKEILNNMLVVFLL